MPPPPLRHFVADPLLVLAVKLPAVIVDQPNRKSSAAGFWQDGSKVDKPGDETRRVALRWVVRLRYGFIAGEIAIAAALRVGDYAGNRNSTCE
jgi:hypothetical protein